MSASAFAVFRRLAFPLLAFGLQLLPLSPGSASEFEVLDDLRVDSYALVIGSAAVEGNSFTVGGGTFAARSGLIGIGTAAPSFLLHVSSAAGAAGDLVVISTGSSAVIRMTGAGEIYASRLYGDGLGLTGLAGGSAGPSIDVSTINAAAATPYGGVVVTTNVFVTGAATIARVTVLAADSGITLTFADLGKTITVDSASAQTVTLPSVTAAEIGATVTVVKLGTGRVTIQAAGAAQIADSSAGGTLYNTAVLPAYAAVTLRLVTATRWVLVGGEGAWLST